MKCRKFLCCIAKKHTKEILSDVYEIEALNEYYAVNKLEELSGIRIDGYSNYMDYVEI